MAVLEKQFQIPPLFLSAAWFAAQAHGAAIATAKGAGAPARTGTAAVQADATAKLRAGLWCEQRVDVWQALPCCSGLLVFFFLPEEGALGPSEFPTPIQPLGCWQCRWHLLLEFLELPSLPVLVGLL